MNEPPTNEVLPVPAAMPDVIELMQEMERKAEAERSVARWFGEIATEGLPSLRRAAELLRRQAAEEEGDSPLSWLPEQAFALARVAPAFDRMKLEFPWQRDVASGHHPRTGAAAALAIAAKSCGDAFLHDPQTRAILAEAACDWLQRNLVLPRGATPAVSAASVHGAILAGNILALGEFSLLQLPGVENDYAEIFEPSLAALPRPDRAGGTALDYVVIHLLCQLLGRPLMDGTPVSSADAASASSAPRRPDFSAAGFGAGALCGVLAGLMESWPLGVVAAALGVAGGISKAWATRRPPPGPVEVKADRFAAARQRWVQALHDPRTERTREELATHDLLAQPEMLLGRAPHQQTGGEPRSFAAEADHLASLMDGVLGPRLIEWLLMRLGRKAAPDGGAVADFAGLLETLLGRTVSPPVWAVVARAAEGLRANCTGEAAPDADWLALLEERAGEANGQASVFSYVRLLVLLEARAAVVESSRQAWEPASADFVRTTRRLVAWVRARRGDGELARSLFQVRYLAAVFDEGKNPGPRTLAVAGEPLSVLHLHLAQRARQLKNSPPEPDTGQAALVEAWQLAWARLNRVPTSGFDAAMRAGSRTTASGIRPARATLPGGLVSFARTAAGVRWLSDRTRPAAPPPPRGGPR